MKKHRSFYELICISGIPWFVICFVGLIYFLSELGVDGYEMAKGIRLSSFQLPAAISFCFWLYVLAQNTNWLSTNKPIGLFTWFEKYDSSLSADLPAKHTAQYPQIPQEYLSSRPDGLVLAKKGKNYVRVDIHKGACLNLALFGAPGSGKSVLLLTTLIYQQNLAALEGKDPFVFFMLDIKPELQKKSVIPNDKLKILSLHRREQYGWDVYYNITPDSSDDDIVSELDVIARALIDAGESTKNEFFYESARNIVIAILFHQLKLGRSFMKSLEYILQSNMETAVTDTLSKVEGKPEFLMVQKLLSPFKGKKGEAMEGIELAARQSLAIFNKQSVIWFLDSNPRKANPNDLEDKISISFEIPEVKLSEYKCLLRLVTNQIIQHCSARPEDSHMIVLLIDEAARLGALNWVDFLSTSRSRQVSTILAMQSLSQMQKVWGKEDAKSLLELCRITAVLSCSDEDTARMFSGWAGNYQAQKRSSNHGGKQRGTYSKSYEDKKILDVVDIMQLQEMQEILMFIKGKYLRADVSGARYFNIPELNKISQKCLTTNSNMERR